MADVPSQTHRRLPFGLLWKYGIVALMSLVVGFVGGYLIHLYSLPPCLVNENQEYVSPHGTFTVRAYTSCFFTRIYIFKNITNDRVAIITDDLAASNRDAQPYNTWFFCPCATRFLGWKSDSRFTILIKNRLEEGLYEYSVDAATGRILQDSLLILE